MEFRLPGIAPASLVDLYKQRALSEREYQMAIEWATKPPERERWSAYLRDWFLIFGILLLVSGVIVFGAYNWQALPRLQKLGLLELLTLGAWLGSRLRGQDSKEGTVLLWAACILVGAFLAVFGQIYQTGADAYTLFAGWSVLILPWCLAGRSNLIWFTQAVLVNTTFALYWNQVVGSDLAVFALSQGALNAALAALWQRARRGRTWMAFGMVEALIANALFPLTGASCIAFWDGDQNLICLAVTVLALAALVKVYGDRVRTMALVACSALSISGSLTIRVLSELDEIGFLLIAVALVAQLTLVARWLREINAGAEHVELQAEEVPRPTVIQVLAAQGLLEGDLAGEPRKVERGSPVYISCLTAVGAWISSWFFLLFVIAGAYDSGGVMTTFGLLLWGGTLWARRRVDTDFLTSLCLAVNLAGQLMVLIGIGDAGNWSTAAMSGAALAMEGVGLFCYRDGIGRGLFAFASVISGGLVSHEIGGDFGLSLWLLAIAFLISRLLIAQRGWLLSRWRYWHGAVAFGWIAGLLTMMAFWGFDMTWIWYWKEVGTVPIAIGLTALAAASALRLQAPPTAVLALVLLGALTFTMPGLMAAMLVFILGYHTRNPGTTWLSVLALLLFGVLYYYNLDLGFLAKSATLVCSGVLLLVARSTLKAQTVRHAF